MTTASRSRRPVRGRSALLWFAACFAAVQLTAGLLLDRVLPEVRFPIWEYVGKHLAARPRPPEILCLGSSRIGCAIDDREMTRLLHLRGEESIQVFNAGLIFCEPVGTEEVLNRILAWNLCPRLVLLDVFPESLHTWDRCIPSRIQRQATWGNLFAYRADIRTLGHLSLLLRGRFLPLLTYRSTILEALATAWERSPPEEYSSLFTVRFPRRYRAGDQNPERLTEELPLVERDLRNYRIGGANPAALERILARLQAEKIPTVLLTPPLAGSHRACYTPEIEATFQTHLRDLTQRFGVLYFDFRDRLPDEDFSDNHHLNEKGAERFTRLVVEEVLPRVGR